MLVGLSKTALPGINTISIAIFAALLPAKASTGALLLLLIVGDIFAITIYRRHADWKTLIRLIPAVVVGVGAGALFLAFASDAWVRRFIGVILLVVIALTLWQRGRAAALARKGRTGSGDPATAADDASHRSSRFTRAAYGSLGGFTTMVANAGGPVMSMYFLAARFPVKAFLGTAAWFFAVINIVKLPVSIGLGLITGETLLLALCLIPGIVVGAIAGMWTARRIPQHLFDWAVIGFTIIGATYLLF
ncbi:sulfite exporter TauE/SafE family protein [Leucobacter sp. gxy201]